MKFFSVAILLLLLIEEGQLSVIYDSVHKSTGHSCSKLAMSLVNDLLKFTSSDMQIC